MENNDKRYWECNCCSQLIVTNKKDNAINYPCPACQVSNCSTMDEFTEITFEQFIKYITK